MTSICLYFEVHQPIRLNRFSVFHIGNNNSDSTYFDSKLNKEIFEKVAEARQGMISGSREERMKSSNQLSSTLKSLFAVAENYPVLKASENFKLLQEQLEGIENKIAYARQYYNSSVLSYNNIITTIPGSWFAGNRTKHAFLTVPEEERSPVKGNEKLQG